MKKLIRITIYTIIVIGGLSCSNPKNDINDIWLGEYELTSYFDNSKSTYNNLNELLDFTNPDSGFRKYFPSYNAIKVYWRLHKGILSIDSTNFRVVTITKDSLVLSPYLAENKVNKPDSGENSIVNAVSERETYFVYKRFKDKRLNYDTLSAFNTISNKIWQRDKNVGESRYFFDWFDFLNNGVCITKIVNDSSNQVHLQDDCWRIESYKNNLFLVFYNNGIQGFWDEKFQICDLNDSVLEIAINGSETAIFKSQLNHKSPSIESQFLGNWVSQNDINKSYLPFLPNRLLERGFMKLYDGSLNYRFEKDTLEISCGKIKFDCVWYVNSDNTILIFEHSVNEECIKGVYVQYSYILESNSNHFSIELFDNYVQTGMDKPNTLVLNRIQEFKRVQ